MSISFLLFQHLGTRRRRSRLSHVTSEIRPSSGGKSGNCVKGSCLLETGDTSSPQVKRAQLGQILLQRGEACQTGLVPDWCDPLQNLKLQGCQSGAAMVGYHHILTAMRKQWLSVVSLSMRRRVEGKKKGNWLQRLRGHLAGLIEEGERGSSARWANQRHMHDEKRHE